MIKMVRNSVFETNSSSCHSISVEYGDVFVGMTPNADNKITSSGGEFGWGVETHWDAPTKLDYLVTHLNGNRDSHQFEMLKEVVCEHTGADDLLMIPSGDQYYTFGYIDHQSYGVANDVFISKSALKNFLFNPDSSLHIDNDNH